MTQTPSLYFAVRPDPPAINTPEYVAWSREQSISFEGGTVTATYGNLIQTFNLPGLTDACSRTSISVSVPSHSRTNTIGGASTTVSGFQYTRQQFNKKNSSLGAAGEPIVIRTDIGQYQARLTGSMTAFADWICKNTGTLYSAITVYSPSGAAYGPFAQVPTP